MCSGSWYAEQWAEKTRAQDFYDMKADVEALLALSVEQTISFQKIDHPVLHPGQSAAILKGKNVIGQMGAIHPRVVKALKLEEPIFAFELELDPLRTCQVPTFHTLSKFPTIRRDIAILVNKQVLAGEIQALVRQCAGEFLQDVCIFDIYQGKGVDLKKKSVALGLILGHTSRTLKETEANDVVAVVLRELREQCGAVLRE